MDYKSLSLANQVYLAIEKNILTGVYKPGEIVSESKLSEELGVSRTPVREAIAKLENDKLLGITPAGTVVLGITEQDVEDMFTVKKLIEPMTFVKAAENITEEDLEKLQDILEQQEFYEEKGNTEKVRNLDTEFHDTIYRASKSPIYESILSNIHHKLMKYRRDSLRNSGRSKDSVKEHYKILEAIKKKDLESVSELVSLHIEAACESIRKGSEE